MVVGRKDAARVPSKAPARVGTMMPGNAATGMEPWRWNWRAPSRHWIKTPTRMVPLARAGPIPVSISSGRISSPPPPARVLIKPAITPEPSKAATSQGSLRYSTSIPRYLSERESIMTCPAGE